MNSLLLAIESTLVVLSVTDTGPTNVLSPLSYNISIAQNPSAQISKFKTKVKPTKMRYSKQASILNALGKSTYSKMTHFYI